jgi:hypothetical protein
MISYLEFRYHCNKLYYKVSALCIVSYNSTWQCAHKFKIAYCTLFIKPLKSEFLLTYKNSAHTPCEAHYGSTTNINQLMVLRDIVENPMTCTKMLWGQNTEFQYVGGGTYRIAWL